MSGLVLCSTARDVRGSPAEQMAALAAPTMTAALQWNRTTLATAVSATRAVCGFSSASWISQVDVPAAVVVTTRDQIVPPGRQLDLARAIPGASVHEVDAGHGACINAPRLFAPALLQACWSVEAGRRGMLRAPA